MNRQLAKQVERLEKEKKDLEILMKQAEEALKKAAGFVDVNKQSLIDIMLMQREELDR